MLRNIAGKKGMADVFGSYQQKLPVESVQSPFKPYFSAPRFLIQSSAEVFFEFLQKNSLIPSSMIYDKYRFRDKNCSAYIIFITFLDYRDEV